MAKFKPRLSTSYWKKESLWEEMLIMCSSTSFSLDNNREIFLGCPKLLDGASCEVRSSFLECKHNVRSRTFDVSHRRLNRPFPNCLVPLFQSEASCRTFHMKMSFICMWMKTHFHIKGYAPRLALKRRYKTTRKWPPPWEIHLRRFFWRSSSANTFLAKVSEECFHLRRLSWSTLTKVGVRSKSS